MGNKHVNRSTRARLDKAKNAHKQREVSTHCPHHILQKLLWLRFHWFSKYISASPSAGKTLMLTHQGLHRVDAGACHLKSKSAQSLTVNRPGSQLRQGPTDLGCRWRGHQHINHHDNDSESAAKFGKTAPVVSGGKHLLCHEKSTHEGLQPKPFANGSTIQQF